MAIIGIDLGTTNSLVSVFKDGQVQLIPNAFGEYLTPSIVSFGDNDEVFVGKIAKEMQITNPSRTFAEFKRNMGTNHLYNVGIRSYRAEELSAFVLRRLKEDAEKFLGESVTEAIISVPAYFDDDKRCATKNAGLLAGLKVDRLVNEPSAVALKHHCNSDEDETFIIFDFGGGTLDVSLVEAFDNMVEIQAVAGDNHLGGKDFNEVIANDFYKKQNLMPKLLSDADRGIVLKEAELLKQELSHTNKASRQLRIGDKEYIMEMSNQELIHLSADLFKRMSEPIRKVINDVTIDWDDVSKIILVGGSSKMPIVRQYIKSLSDIEVVTDENPDESIALGVGIAAGIKERTGEIKDMILADICPFSLGIGIKDGIFSPIIERNTTLPCKASHRYVTVSDYQTSLVFDVYQGENLVAADNLRLCTLELNDLPAAPAGEIGATVTFMYDINGILDIHIEVEGRGLREGKSLHKVIVNKGNTLSGPEIEAHLARLRQMTLHPSEQEENRLLIERAQRLYTECNPQLRPAIVNALAHFKEALNSKKGRPIREEYVRFSIFLSSIEENSFEFEDFDESFWTDIEDNE